MPQKAQLRARAMLQEWQSALGSGSVEVVEKVAIVSAVGIGMKSHSGVAATMFQALAECGANIEMISTSEIKLSVVLHPDQGRKALEALHKAFNLGEASE